MFKLLFALIGPYVGYRVALQLIVWMFVESPGGYAFGPPMVAVMIGPPCGLFAGIVIGHRIDTHRKWRRILRRNQVF